MADFKKEKVSQRICSKRLSNNQMFHCNTVCLYVSVLRGSGLQNATAFHRKRLYWHEAGPELTKSDRAASRAMNAA